jgi:hypothetical protein
MAAEPHGRQVRNRASVDRRTTSPLPDAGGRSVVEGGDIPYQLWAAEKKRANFTNRATADPVASCYIPGVPRIMYMEWPFQIVQTRDHLGMIFEWTQNYRLIYTNGSPHDDRAQPWMGDSRGRWEGDTLVVDVSHHNDKTWFDMAGNFHSDALHLVERYTMLNADTIQYEVTIEDPKVFTRPWKISMPLFRQQGVDRILGSLSGEGRVTAHWPRASRLVSRIDVPNRAPFGPPALTSAAGKRPLRFMMADGKADLNGFWEADGGGANYGLEAHPPSAGNLTPPGRGVISDPADGKLPFQPWARDEREERETPVRGYDDPTAHCFPAGVPRSVYVPVPFHLVQTPDTIITLHERTSWRVIAFNRTRHLPDNMRLWQGDSLGRWDGDTLVVETTNFNGKTWGSEVGDVFSHAEHVTERFKPVDADTIQYEAIITDPIVYTRPFTISMPLHRLKSDLLEAACHEEDHDLPVLKRVRDQERARIGAAPTQAR